MERLAPNRNAILMACRVPDNRNLYVIGSLARRVSFATQQRRAFNLPHAIDDDLKRSGYSEGLEGKNVAVIGASLAGLTVSMALTAFKANVFIYDGQSEPLLHLSEADHRPIHPSINFWPREVVKPATEFPVMNWFHDDCKSLQENLVHAHERLEDKLKSYQIYRRLIRFNRTIQQIERIRPDDDDWSEDKYTLLEMDRINADKDGKLTNLKPISFDGETGDQDKFDIVVLAVGFGTDDMAAEELQGADGPHTYWKRSHDFVSMNGSFEPYENVVISGAGDGGLIELIRLLFGDVFNFPYEEAIKVLLNDATIQKRINRIEAEAQKRFFDSQILSGTQSVDQVLEEIGLLLKRQYQLIAKQIGDFPKRWLYDQFNEIDRFHREERSAARPKVWLIGIGASAYELGVAPIHKLLAAFAENENWFEYARVAPNWSRDPTSEVQDKHGRTHMPPPAKISATRIVCGGKQESLPLDDCLVIERHGAIRELKLLRNLDPTINTKTGLKLKTKQNVPSLSDRVRRLQLMYSENDWIDPAAWQLYMERFFEGADNRRLAHATLHSDIANKYLKKFHGLEVTTAPEGHYIYFPDRSNANQDLKNSKPPSSLFTVELVSGSSSIDASSAPLRSF